MVPAGQTSTTVAIPTVTDNTVESDRTLIVTLAPELGLPDRDAEQRRR